MKVSELWLREWVNPALTGQQLGEQLTMAGLEVDGIHPVAGSFSNVIVAKVLRTMPHPDADKLTLCDVDKGSNETLQIVCGASNVRENLRVALALPGATLPNGLIIKESKLRGQLSQGMLCSASELGLEDSSEGIIELALDAPIGTNIRDYLGLDDQVFELDLTPNRADCFSILGVAREVAVLNRMPLKEMLLPIINPTIADQLKVHVTAKAACPHYCGRVIRNINSNAITPTWMQERLRRSGVRVLHPVVDVTNYVMLELGQPMHAFDLSTIDGDIYVRFNKPDEKLTLLDGQEVILKDEVLVIADDKKTLNMAGVMGGESSAVQKETQHIFLESAYFNPLNIAGVARRYGFSSDSSMRFERGVDPSLQIRALERATQLLISIVGGDVGPISEVLANEKQAATIVFQPNKVQKLTGVELSQEEMKIMLQGLGMKIEVMSSHWLVSVPSHRFDIRLDVDLVEEIIRLYGYNNIPSIPCSGVLKAGRVNKEDAYISEMATLLCTRGYQETISYSFVDPELQKVIYPNASVMSLLNPISSELSEMRAGLWPGLLASMLHNIHRQQNALKLFEAGVVFEKNGSEVIEKTCIAGLLTGETGHNWNETKRLFDFYDMTGDLQALAHVFSNTKLIFINDTHEALHPGQTARIQLNDRSIGWVGVVHPKITDLLDLTQDIIVFELSINTFPEKGTTRYQRISKYPQIKRDLSLLVDQSVSALQIEQAIREVVAQELLKDFEVFDLYTGETIPQDKKSLAVSLTLQDDNRTLIDREINEIMDAIIEKLSKDHAIKLRE